MKKKYIKPSIELYSLKSNCILCYSGGPLAAPTPTLFLDNLEDEAVMM
jgi:hypothetical protein